MCLRNDPKCTQTLCNAPKHEFRVQWGGLGALVAKNSDATLYHELLYQFGPFCTEFRKSTKLSQMHQHCTKMHQNLSLGSNRVERVRWLRKIPMRLRGTNFCTSSAHFAPSFVSQPNGRNAPKLYEMHQNICSGSYRIYRVRSFRKISTPLRATNFCTSSARFAPSFISQPNSP